MAIFTPILDIVAGVSILVGNTTVLDTPILRLTLRQILGFSFAGIGLGNLWVIREARKKGE